MKYKIDQTNKHTLEIIISIDCSRKLKKVNNIGTSKILEQESRNSNSTKKFNEKSVKLKPLALAI